MLEEYCSHSGFSSKPGKWGICEDCSRILWKIKENGPIFSVPTLRENVTISVGNRRTIIDIARNPQDCQSFDNGFTIRTRINADLDFIDGMNSIKNSASRTKTREKRLKEISDRIEKFGLVITRLVNDSEIEKNEPIIIHRGDLDPFLNIPSLDAACDGITNPLPNPSLDSRWVTWEPVISSNFAGYQLKNMQTQAIKRVLKEKRSFTIVGLPTGYGKSVIAQIATQLLRNTKGGDNGPTLMISPLISLMDDQRIRWNEQFNLKLRNNGLEQLNCKFLTPSETEDKRKIISDLINDKIDLLCCSPESILKPRIGGNDNWMAAFQKMRNPFSLMVVDEAHTIADWGASIRPEFQLLDTVKRMIIRGNENLRLLLMSATITDSEERELRRMFDVSNTMKSSGETLREMDSNACATRRDLMFDLKRIKSEELNDSIEEIKLARNHITKFNSWNRDSDGKLYRRDGRPSPSVVFTRMKADAHSLKMEFDTKLSTNAVQTYPGDTGPFSRERRLRDFLENKMRFLVATSAFGMGVDKKDVWLAAYLGQPYTLKGLYQAFGRAARDSNWDGDGNKRSGLCIGRFYGKGQSFNPRMGLKLSLERVYDLLSNAQEGPVAKGGYLALDLLNDPTIGWSTNEKNSMEIEIDFEDDTGQDEYDNCNWASSTIDLHNEEELRRIHNEIKARESKNRSLNAHVNLRLWVLSCLERTGAVSIMGIHPRRIKLKNLQDQIHILDYISNCGSYLDAMNNLDRSDSNNQLRELVYIIRLNRTMKTFQDIRSEIEKGINLLKERHDIGLSEMNQFMDTITKKGGCIRKAFAPSVGRTKKEEASCIESIRDHNQAVMPCSNCRTDVWLRDMGFPQTGFLLSTDDVLNVIEDKTKIQKKGEKDVYFQIKGVEEYEIIECNFRYPIRMDDFGQSVPPKENITSKRMVCISAKWKLLKIMPYLLYTKKIEINYFSQMGLYSNLSTIR